MRDMLIFFFFNDTATTEIYTLSLHDALPIFECYLRFQGTSVAQPVRALTKFQRITLAPGETRKVTFLLGPNALDRKSTRLNSSHGYISYAVFCLKKKKTLLTYSLCIYRFV